MFIPYRVDVPFNHRPVVNWLIVITVVLIFAIQINELSEYTGKGRAGLQEYIQNSTTMQYMLKGWGIKGLFGYMWLHSGPIHLIGNLIFLWLFGNAVCSKIGNLYYLPVYVVLGVFAAVSHLLFSGGSAVGASGAINGLVGMYLAFFPENEISCFFFLIFYPIRFSVRSFWMILLWFAFDILGAIYGLGRTAYYAHIGGFAAGFGLALLMLKTKWITMEKDEKSILELLEYERREKPEGPVEEVEYWQQEWKEREKLERKKSSLKLDDDPKNYIHLECRCGKRFKISRQYAGKICECPKCSARWKVPGI